MKPRTILVLGWLVFLMYAYPGFMSYDSVLQLGQARSGVYGGGHPPIMGALWAAVDYVIPGPFGMLVLQSTCFLAGVYLWLRQALPERTAAIAACVVLCFPPIAAVLAVIWKDSQMTAFIALGSALLLSPRLAVRFGGLALLAVGTAMRYNALAVTLPLVVLLFEWSPSHRWFVRYPLALAAWVAITVAASSANSSLEASAAGKVHMWNESIALCDLTGTLRYAPDIPDSELAGLPVKITSGIQAATRRDFPTTDLTEHEVLTFGTGTYAPALWNTTHHVFRPAESEQERDAVTSAWRRIVLGHPVAFLEYRAHMFRELVHFGDSDIPSGAYVWFTDVLDLSGSARATGHTATPSRAQRHLFDAMSWLGTSFLFRPWIYLAILLALAPLWLRRRDLAALGLSGLANEAVLFLIAPTVDYRYSIWLVVVTAVTVARLVSRHRFQSVVNA
jgi:hypothetical protein